jgi:hypothetical protein
MMTTSHAFFTYAAMPGGGVALAVLGAVLPDIPFWIGPPVVAMQRRRWRGALDATKDHPLFGVLLRAGHSAVVWAVAAIICAWQAPVLMPLIWGWLGHWFSDLLTHHGEPHAHLYPFSDWRFASPVSYYEWDHHAAAFMTGEALVAGVILTAWYRHEPVGTTLHLLWRQPLAVAAVVVLLTLLWWVAYRRPALSRLEDVESVAISAAGGDAGRAEPGGPLTGRVDRDSELTGLANVD